MTCTVCGKRAYSDRCTMHKIRKPIKVNKPLARSTKPIKQRSKKENQYQYYKEATMRPAVIARDGNKCWCCGRPAYHDEKLDLEHQLTKGSRPDLKRDIANIRLYCRFPCHRNKTDGRPCLH